MVAGVKHPSLLPKSVKHSEKKFLKDWSSACIGQTSRHNRVLSQEQKQKENKVPFCRHLVHQTSTFLKTFKENSWITNFGRNYSSE